MKRGIFLFCFTVFISGCSTQDAARGFCGKGGDETMALVCVSAVATSLALNDGENSGQRCSEMSGSKKSECQAQVEKLKEHIQNRTK